jgi:hypothetical protein
MHPLNRWLTTANACGYGAVALALLSAIACWVSLPRRPRDDNEPGRLGRPIPVRSAPIALTVYPLQGWTCEEGDLVTVADVIRPYFQRNKVPVALVYHALRVWGPRAPFSPVEVTVAPSDGLSGEGLFLRTLTDQQAYQTYSMITLNRLLVPSPFGVQVVTSVIDLGWGQEWGSTHVGKYLQVMADLDMPSDTPLHLAEDRRAVLADVIQDEARRYHTTFEPEWIACALCRYLSTPRWQNRFGQWCSIDDLAGLLVDRPFGVGACNGTHVPYALATLLNVHQKTPLLSRVREAEVRHRLLEFSNQLSRSQHPDGSWPGRWWPSETKPGIQGEYLDLVQTQVLATGHHLEWMVLCPPELRPDPAVLARAAGFLTRTIPMLREHIKRDLHTYLATSHAVRALVLASGRRWADPSWLRKAADRVSAWVEPTPETGHRRGERKKGLATPVWKDPSAFRSGTSRSLSRSDARSTPPASIPSRSSS